MDFQKITTFSKVFSTLFWLFSDVQMLSEFEITRKGFLHN